MEMQLALAAVPMSIARPLVKNWKRDGLGVQVIKRFLPKNKKQKKNAYRIYMPIKPTKQKIVVPDNITMALTHKGYVVDDYINGIAVDSSGKRQMRIGKLLKDAELLKEFMNDPQRAAHKDEFTCVVSCHPYDVLTMSTGRRWDMTSCMRLDQPGKAIGGVNQHIVRHDIAEGTLVAYAISPKDRNINKPHARLLLKPFVGPNGQIMYHIGSKVYGTPIPGFESTISRWLRKVNSGAGAGMYHLVEGLYADGLGKERLHGNYEDNPDKVGTLRNLKLHEDKLRDFLLNDKRWLQFFLKHAVEIYNGSEAEAAYQISALYGSNQARITARQFGKLLDENLDPNVVLDLTEVLSPLTWRAELIKNSKLLKETADEVYSFDPKSDEGFSPDYVLNHVGFYDSRWLSRIEDEIPAEKVVSAWRSFLAGMYKWTPELAKSKHKGSIQLREQVGFLLKMLDQSAYRERRYNETLAKELLKKFPVDTYYTDEMNEFLEEARFNVIFNRYCGDSGKTLLCTLDNSWPAARMDLLIDADRRILTDQETFEKLMKVSTQQFYTGLAVRMQMDVIRQALSPSLYKREFPWAVKLIHMVAAQQPGPYPEALNRWANSFIADYKKSDKEMDDILAELEMDDIEFKPAPQNDGFH